MKKFLSDLCSSNGDVSSKRVIAIAAFIMMCIGFIANLFFKLTITESIYDSMKWIVIGGLGFTASEQFTGKNGASGSTTIGTPPVPPTPPVDDTDTPDTPDTN